MHDNRGFHFSSLGVQEILDTYPGLRIRPLRGDGLRIGGTLEFRACQGEVEVAEAFEVEMIVSRDFPTSPVAVCEIGGRIPPDFHRYDDHFLCLGSPLRLKMEAAAHPTILGFIEAVVIPYFFNFIVGQRTGHLPLEELAHGTHGVLADYRRMLGARTDDECRDFIFLLTIKKRLANKWKCPCGSERRLGKCHNRKLNRLRPIVSRAWFRNELRRLVRPE